MKNILFLFLFPVLFFSCFNDSDSTGDSPDGFLKKEGICSDTDLNWLEEMIADYSAQTFTKQEFFYFSKALYNNEVVIIQGNCCPSCNSIMPVYDCYGDLLGNIGSNPGDITPEVMENQQLIWPDNSTCFN
ncbi:hypothetical protein [Abyssalbus ytuae]|uniref:Lipoprotein n=1 Tax=Abyssalbus ytuae TaxID=2926907 RepID=A0A9E6ZVF4_9FLAO|nr:hypothetical protein [Abyssalbus ytuae]UOB15952.1 hypothetical protein MQE35_09385 [Abyssalbus ytuae]